MDNELKVLSAKVCYGHLGGTLGNRLFDRLVELKWFEQDKENDRLYKITEKGKNELEKFGVDIYERRNKNRI